MKRTWIVSPILALALAGVPTYSFASPALQQTAADNSAQNAKKKVTADNQSNAGTDRHMAAQIRKAIIADNSISFDGKNCKVIVSGGQVTLSGPVKSEDEKQKIAQDAASVVNADSISNHLTVKQ